jgi:hypothetical protein
LRQSINPPSQGQQACSLRNIVNALAGCWDAHAAPRSGTAAPSAATAAICHAATVEAVAHTWW